jgi:hypothetical protein
MLRTHGWTDEATRTAEIERVRRTLSTVSLAARMQVSQALKLIGAASSAARDLAAHCQPITAGVLAAALAALNPGWTTGRGRLRCTLAQGHRRTAAADRRSTGTPRLITAQRV